MCLFVDGVVVVYARLIVSHVEIIVGCCVSCVFFSCCCIWFVVVGGGWPALNRFFWLGCRFGVLVLVGANFGREYMLR
jgi:hypothetical protein